MGERVRRASSQVSRSAMEDGPLRILCTEITPYRQLQARAQAELGFELSFIQRDFQTAQRIAATEPDSYDIYDQCFHNLDIVWHWRAVQAIDIERIDLWSKINGLTKYGRIGLTAAVAVGDAPVSRLYVQDDQSLSSMPTGKISMLPTAHNFDSFGINETASGIDVDADVHSWSELLNPRWFGRVAIVDEPAIGVFDIALAARSAGRIEFDDIGNMSVEEIDALIDFATELRDSGHLATFWRTTEEATGLMESGETWISSMWSPSVVALKSRQRTIRQAVPVEGYRAWHGGLCLARHLRGHRLDRAYAYLNWFISGWPGSILARQGYYMSVDGRVREFLDEDEWNYWYNGQPAGRPLPDPSGRPAIREGAIRSGGPYWKRASHIALWNSTMDEHNYLVRRWNHFISRSHSLPQRRRMG